MVETEWLCSCSLTEKDRLPTSNEGTDTSDSDDEEVVESEYEEDEEEQQGQNEEFEEETLFGFSTEETWEQHYDEDVGKLNVPSSSSAGIGDDSLGNWDTAEQHGVDNTKETVAVGQMLEDSASSFAEGQQPTEDNLTIGEYKSEYKFQSASDNGSGSDDSTEEHFQMYNTVFAPQSYSLDTQAQAMLPLQSSLPSVHPRVIGESPVVSESDSADEYLSASEDDEESFGVHEQSQAMKKDLQIVSVGEATYVSAGLEPSVTQEVTQKQPATDLPRHQFQDTEETLEQVIKLPEQAEALADVSQGKTVSEQEEVHSSDQVEENPLSTQLPGPSPAAGIKAPCSTIQAEIRSSAWFEEASRSTQLPGPSPAASTMTPSNTIQGESVTSVS